MKLRRTGLLWTIVTLTVLSIGTLTVTTYASAAEYNNQEDQGLPIETSLGIYIGTWAGAILGAGAVITAVVLVVALIADARAAARR
jgi:hypothetical protein